MITSEKIKSLREKTGAGMMDCKKALVEVQGDLESAIDWLRKKGISTAAKKSSRDASDGLITILQDESNICILEVNSETDFVARNDDFQDFCLKLSKTILSYKINKIGELLGTRGKEFGTVTSRKRRCGWFDGVLVRQTIKISGIDGIALTKLDVLDELDEIKMCVEYDLNGKKIDYLPAAVEDQLKIKPIYKTFDGWKTSTNGVKNINDLPENAKKYLFAIEDFIGAKISSISTSPERDDTILVENPFEI